MRKFAPSVQFPPIHPVLTPKGVLVPRNKVALVSGGSRGIGAATVLRLAAAGWDVALPRRRRRRRAGSACARTWWRPA